MRRGRSLSASSICSNSPEGTIFPGPGEYRLAAHYRPSPQAEPVASPSVPVSVVTPRTEAERELAALLADPAVRLGLVLGDPESAPRTLGEIAGRFPGTLEARLAGLVSGAAAGDGADADEAPVETALAIVALTNPYNRTGRLRSGELAARFERRMAAGDAGPELLHALKLLRGEPLAGFGRG